MTAVSQQMGATGSPMPAAALPSSVVRYVATEDVTRTYPGVAALRGVDFDLHGGEVHAVVGENGAGKSTLVRLLSGFERPSSGRVRFDGVEVNATPALARAHGIVTVYQDRQLVPGLNIAENVALGGAPACGPLLDRRALHAGACAASSASASGSTRPLACRGCRSPSVSSWSSRARCTVDRAS